MDVINVSILKTHLKPSIYTTTHQCKNTFWSQFFQFFYHLPLIFVTLITMSHNLNFKLLRIKKYSVLRILVQWDHEQWATATIAPLKTNTYNKLIITFQAFLYHFEAHFYLYFLSRAIKGAVWFAFKHEQDAKCSAALHSAACAPQRASSTEKTPL